MIKTLIVTRDISHDAVKFRDNSVYNNQPAKRQLAIETVVEFGKVSGLDDAGAVEAEISSVLTCTSRYHEKVMC